MVHSIYIHIFSLTIINILIMMVMDVGWSLF